MRKMIFVSLLMFGMNAFAAAGDAGCGLGSLIWTKNTKLLQLFATTTNGTSASQAFGITSGTSNCSSSGLVMNDKQIEYFVEVNQEDLSREMAQGHGDKLNTLAALNGCMTVESQKAFSQMTQQSYSKIVPQADIQATDMVRNLKSEVAQSNLCVQGS